jgi:hypothetical protein
VCEVCPTNSIVERTSLLAKPKVESMHLKWKKFLIRGVQINFELYKLLKYRLHFNFINLLNANFQQFKIVNVMHKIVNYIIPPVGVKNKLELSEWVVFPERK